MLIDKDTKLYGSFSKSAGSIGCRIFNKCFDYCKINAIYKSFSVNNIYDAIQSAKCLGFSGFAVSMPFKNEIIKYLDNYDDIVTKTKSCNTVLINNSKLYGYNTDYLAIKTYLMTYHKDVTYIYILGNGGYSQTLQSYCNDSFINFQVITRGDWIKISTIRNATVFNCTPVSNIDIDSSNIYIDCINTTPTGEKLAIIQASAQFKLYTHIDFPNQLFSD